MQTLKIIELRCPKCEAKVIAADYHEYIQCQNKTCRAFFNIKTGKVVTLEDYKSAYSTRNAAQH